MRALLLGCNSKSDIVRWTTARRNMLREGWKEDPEWAHEDQIRASAESVGV